MYDIVYGQKPYSITQTIFILLINMLKYIIPLFFIHFYLIRLKEYIKIKNTIFAFKCGYSIKNLAIY